MQYPAQDEGESDSDCVAIFVRPTQQPMGIFDHPN
jgi:hypothetical protein